MRVLIAHTFCDVCKREDVQSDADEGDSIRLTVHGRAKRLDVCAEHKNPDWATLTECMIDDLDASLAAHGKVRGDVPCPWCDGRMASAQGVLMHATRRHTDIPLGDMQKRLGFPVTDRNANKDRPLVRDEPQPCEECGKMFDTVQGMNMHKLRVHEGKGGNPTGKARKH